MSLVVANKDASAFGALSKYEDGTRPRLIDAPTKPKPPEEDQTAKALMALASAIQAQAGNLDGQRAALIELLKSNIVASAVMSRMAEPKPEEWSFDHVYDKNGDLIKTIAKRTT